MNRRDLLAVGAVTALAGCLGYDVVDEERVSERRVRLAELEATVDAREAEIRALEADLQAAAIRIDRAEASREVLARQLRGPRVNDLALVDRWERLGDVVHRATDQVVAGELATIAVNFTTPSVGLDTARGRQAEAAERLTTVTVTLRDGTGGTVETRERELRYFIEVGRLGETQLLFDTRGFDPGAYRAEARVRDSVAGIESRPVTTRFTVVSGASESRAVVTGDS